MPCPEKISPFLPKAALAPSLPPSCSSNPYMHPGSSQQQNQNFPFPRPCSSSFSHYFFFLPTSYFLIAPHSDSAHRLFTLDVSLFPLQSNDQASPLGIFVKIRNYKSEVNPVPAPQCQKGKQQIVVKITFKPQP